MSAERHPLGELKIDDVIVGPFGRYEFRVTELLGEFVFGVYTQCPEGGYTIGGHAAYLTSDWNAAGGFEYALAHAEPARLTSPSPTPGASPPEPA